MPQEERAEQEDGGDGFVSSHFMWLLASKTHFAGNPQYI